MLMTNKLKLIFFILALQVSVFGHTYPSAVVSAHPKATLAGMKILEAGGNAFDAAIAVASTLAVVEPYSSGIGGGGFFLIHQFETNRYSFIDARETAPSAAHKDMYLTSSGEVNRNSSLNGPLAAAIPGLPAGLVYLAQNYGSMDAKETFKDAIALAENGFRVGDRYIRMAGYRKKSLEDFSESEEIFFRDESNKDNLVVQKDLAKTLRSISKDGGESFYKGKIARALVKSVREHGGIWSLSDLSEYKVRERDPLIATFGKTKIISAPPPSSGGLVLFQALKILEKFPLNNMTESNRTHLITEAMKRGYRDRADYMGDPDFFNVPVKRLLSDAHIDKLSSDLNVNKATPSVNLNPLTDAPEGQDTTHFSILDKFGNKVSATLSINYPFGSSFVASGTGVLLNNEMDDFSARPFSPNGYGLIGTQANAISPRKRPLSSMTPTFLEFKNNFGIVGTPGGSRIISMVLIAALEFMEGELPEVWVSARRFHHQYMPDLLQFEKGAFSQEEQKQLAQKGHRLKELSRRYGNMQAILYDGTLRKVYTASDPRGEGSAMQMD